MLIDCDSVQNARHMSGEAGDVRRHFAKTGSLSNSNDDQFRPIGDRTPVFAFSHSFKFGKSASRSHTVTFTVALIQIPVVQFAAARGLTMMRPLWKSYYQTAEQLLYWHYHDYTAASALASNYSAQLAKDAYLSGADDYVDIVALSARQVMGATQFSGTPDNPILFLKEISSNGNFQTIDVIFPAFPFFLYTNPRWLAYLLEPLIEHMLSGQYPNTYAMHDLGTHFPNATGHADGNDEYMPVEECGNILIMGLAVANSLQYGESSEAASLWSALGTPRSSMITADSSLFPLDDLQVMSGIGYQDSRWGGGIEGTKLAKKWVERSYRLWKQWTGYLVEFSLEPANQREYFFFAPPSQTCRIKNAVTNHFYTYLVSTDDFAGWLALQTNLALKGIVGIKAMSKLSELVGNDTDASYYKVRKHVILAPIKKQNPISPVAHPFNLRKLPRITSPNGKNSECPVTAPMLNSHMTGTDLGRPSTTFTVTHSCASTSRIPSHHCRHHPYPSQRASPEPQGLSPVTSTKSSQSGTITCVKSTVFLSTVAICTPRRTGNSSPWPSRPNPCAPKFLNRWHAGSTRRSLIDLLPICTTPRETGTFPGPISSLDP